MAYFSVLDTNDIRTTKLNDFYADAATTAVADVTGLIGGFTAIAESRAELAALPSSYVGVWFDGSVWTFDSSDLSADVTADPQQGLHVPPTGEDGSGGAWVRHATTLTPFNFQCVGDGTTDDLPALQAFCDWLFAQEDRKYAANFSGYFAISGQLTCGPAASDQAPNWRLGGSLKLKQLTASFETIRLRNLGQEQWIGSISAIGSGVNNQFASRTSGCGIVFENCGNMTITGGVYAERYWFAGIISPVVNNDGITLGQSIARFCGSGSPTDASYTLSGNYSGAVDTGSSGSIAQRTTITVDTFPDEAIETWADVGFQSIYILIGEQFHWVESWDRVAGTATVFPWVDLNAPSGTFQWVFGGGFVTQTEDGNCIFIGKMKSQNCGIGYLCNSLYGARIGSAVNTGCGIGIMIGKNLNPACVGVSVDAYYPESNTLDIGISSRFAGSYHHYINSTFELHLQKVKNLSSARLSDNSISEWPLGSNVGGAGLTLAFEGRIYEWFQQNLSNLSAASKNFYEHRARPATYTQHRNSQTVTLQALGHDATVLTKSDYDRLFGYRGACYRYIGTGSNGAPTGTFTFAPPTLAYEDCTTSNGSAVVTMADTTGLFAGMPITGVGIPASTTILTVDSATQITLSANATASGTVDLTVTGSLNGAYVNVAFSSFMGPAEFSIEHTDKYQLVWIVRCVAGQQARAGATTASGLTVSATDRLLGRSTAGAGAVEEITCTSFARTLLDDADAATAQTTLGISAFAQTLLDDADAAAGRATLGLGSAAVANQAALVTNLTVTSSSGILPTASGSVTVSATSPTNAELLEFCIELEDKLETLLLYLKNAGLMATI